MNLEQNTSEIFFNLLEIWLCGICQFLEWYDVFNSCRWFETHPTCRSSDEVVIVYFCFLVGVVFVFLWIRSLLVFDVGKINNLYGLSERNLWRKNSSRFRISVTMVTRATKNNFFIFYEFHFCWRWCLSEFGLVLIFHNERQNVRVRRVVLFSSSGRISKIVKRSMSYSLSLPTLMKQQWEKFLCTSLLYHVIVSWDSVTPKFELRESAGLPEGPNLSCTWANHLPS